MISVIRPANITPLSLVKMTTQTSSQWLALPSFDEVPFVRKNTRITAKIQSQIRPIAASTSNIEQWCPREIIWYAFGDLSCLSDESISWLYLFNKQLEKQYWGGARMTQVRETIHVAEVRKHGDDVITSFRKDLDTCTTKGTTTNQQS